MSQTRNTVQSAGSERSRFLTSLFATALAAAGVTLLVSCGVAAPPPAVAPEAAPRSLQVSELVVVDRNGTPRVRISGDLPDAVINGRRVPRGERAAGVLLYDSTGQERSGYVSWEPSGNVGLTLDTKAGQVAFFVAGRESAAALQLWRGRDVLELRSDADGSRFTAVKNGTVVFQDPEITSITGPTCTAYKDARARVSSSQVFSDCRRRFGEAACRQCLAIPEP